MKLTGNEPAIESIHNLTLSKMGNVEGELRTALTIKQQLAKDFMITLINDEVTELEDIKLIKNYYENMAKIAFIAADSFIKVNNEL